MRIQNPAAPPAPDWLTTTFRSLRHRNYRLYFVGQIVSLTGTWVQMTAQTWLAYKLDNGSFGPALISAAQVLPTLALGIWGGSLADRLPRRWLIFSTQSAMLVLALVLATLVGLEWMTIGLLLGLSLVLGVINAIDTPARLAFVIDMVGREDLVNAVALNSLVFNSARAIGPAVAGLLLRLFDDGTTLRNVAACFLVNGLTFLSILVALLAMRLPPARRLAAEPDAGSLRGAISHLGRNPSLVLLLVLAGSVAYFGWPVLSLLPALADRELLAGERGYSALLSGVGVGALFGALLVAGFGKTSRRRGFLTAGVLVGIASLVGLAASPVLWVAVGCSALSGCGLILFFATGQAIMQLGADEHNRGTIMGVWLMILSGAQPLGNLVAGNLADRIGVTSVLLLDAVGIGVAGLAVWFVAVAGGHRWRAP